VNFKSFKKLTSLLHDQLANEAVENEDAKLLKQDLEPIFKKIYDSNDFFTVENVPGKYYVHEGSLRKNKELEKTYSKFCFYLEGGTDKKLKEIKSKILNNK